MKGKHPTLSVDGLTVCFPRIPGMPVIDDAGLVIHAGEIHGLVGESGSGKTLLARAVLDLLPPGAAVTAGSIRFQGRELVGLPAKGMRALRGHRIGMVFQEPMMSLNPALRIGRQMAETLHLHTDLGEAEIRRQSIEMLERVRMPDAASCLNRYPHEFSGGMRQRIMLASVLMARPALLLADEPTTALDVLIQQEIVEIMLEVVRDLGTAVLLISHDLSLVAKYAQRITVMQKGRVVEQGSVERTLARPRQEYTRRLLAALPRRSSGHGNQSSATPLLDVRELSTIFRKPSPWPWRRPRTVQAVDGVSFKLHRNETLAVVGESGSGKTTLGRTILKLVDRSAGRILFDGRDIHELTGKAERELRRNMQIVFQDPYSSLDPRKRIGQIVGEGLRLIPGLSRRERRERVAGMLEAVDIDRHWVDRHPHELSGGQRQRIGIARALITHPQLIVADEAVSALDLTVQAQVLKLLQRLQQSIGFSILFITHDLGVVGEIADRIMVLYRGRIVELGSRHDIFDRPHHPYTCALLNAVPELAGDPAEGYRIRTRRHSVPLPPNGYTADMSYPGEPPPGFRSSLVELDDGHIAAFALPT